MGTIIYSKQLSITTQVDLIARLNLPLSITIHFQPSSVPFAEFVISSRIVGEVERWKPNERQNEKMGARLSERFTATN
jgi:hypothetical protein